MKKLLVLAALFILSGSALADTVLYQTNFNDMDLGPIYQNYPEEWLLFYGTPNEDNYMDVVEGGFGGGGRSLRYYSTDRLIGTWTVIPDSYDHSLTKNFKVSFMVNFAKLNSHISLNSHPDEGMGELQFHKRGEDQFYIKGADLSFEVTNTCPVGTWVPVSYVLNSCPGNRKLLSLQFGNVLYDNLDVLIDTEEEQDCFPHFLFLCWGDLDVYIDDFKVELVNRDVGNVQLAMVGNSRIELGGDSTAVRVINEGTQSGMVTVASDQEFVKLNGEKEITETIEAGASVTVNVTVDRASMGNDYYYATITASSGGAMAEFPLFIQSGVEGEGYTYYKGHFDKFEIGKDIRTVDPAWKNGYGTPDNSPVVIMGGDYAVQLNYKSYNAFHIKCGTKAGTSDAYNYRVSFKGLIPSGYDKYNQYNLGSTANVDGGEVINLELKMRYAEEAGGIIFDYMGNTCPLDEWFDVAYTFNYKPENCRFLTVTFGNVTSNLNVLIPNASGGRDYFDYFRFFGWCEASSAPIFIKDLVVEAVAREDVGPQLEVGRGGQVFLNENTSSLTVLNAGTGNLAFKAEVTAGGGWLSIREADEETGILEDTIVGSGSKKYNLDIARGELGNAYGLGQITVTGAGESKIVNIFVQSGDETGATLYANDFDSMELGNIRLSDPAWTGGAEGRVVIDPTSGGNCLEILGDNQQFHATCKAPSGSSADYNYVVRMKLMFPSGATGPFFITGNDLDHAMGEYGYYIEEGKLRIDTRNCGNNPLYEAAAPLGEWVDVAYTYNGDPLNCRLLSLTFGEETVECSEPITFTRGLDFFEEFRIYVFGNGAKETFYIDDLSIGLEPKDASKPGVMDIRVQANPIPYTDSSTVINILNAGGRAFTYNAEVTQGAEWLTLSKYSGTVGSSDSFTASVDRAKLGYGFHRAVIKFTSSEGEVKKLTVGAQAGSAEEGYVLYASDIDSLVLSEITDEGVTDELSEQDACWDRGTLHNCAAVSVDPKDSGKKCIQMINANDWSKYCGYILNVNAPAEAAADYDIVISMQMLVPDTYVDLPEDEYEHPYSAFFISQDNDHRQNELYLYLDENGGSMNVFADLQDIHNTNWWYENLESSAPVPNNEWFTYYTRFNCKLVDFMYKRFYAFTMGENEYHLEGEDQMVDYPRGISEEVLLNEAMPTVKFFSYRDDANILMKDITVSLVPHNAIPEPAAFAFILLIALALQRKAR